MLVDESLYHSCMIRYVVRDLVVGRALREMTLD